jgi:hypothetical protein
MITRVLSATLIVLGIAVVVRTLAEGIGGGVGLLVGALLVFVGSIRFYAAGVR